MSEDAQQQQVVRSRCGRLASRSVLQGHQTDKSEITARMPHNGTRNLLIKADRKGATEPETRTWRELDIPEREEHRRTPRDTGEQHAHSQTEGVADPGEAASLQFDSWW
jgi:hypothetical protein